MVKLRRTCLQIKIKDCRQKLLEIVNLVLDSHVKIISDAGKTRTYSILWLMTKYLQNFTLTNYIKC